MGGRWGWFPTPHALQKQSWKAHAKSLSSAGKNITRCRSDSRHNVGWHCVLKSQCWLAPCSKFLIYIFVIFQLSLFVHEILNVNGHNFWKFGPSKCVLACSQHIQIMHRAWDQPTRCNLDFLWPMRCKHVLVCPISLNEIL